MSFDTFIANQLDVSNYGDWLVVLNPVSPLGVTTPLYFSRRGTSTAAAVPVPNTPYTLPAHTQFRRRLTLAPTFTHSLWQRGRIGGESVPNYGNLGLVNQDGGLDAYRPTPGGWRWKNTPCQVYFCDTRPKHVASTIGCVFDGLVSDCKIDLRGVTISLAGFEQRYGEMTSERVFRGTGYQLGLAIDAIVDYGDVTAVELQESMSLEFWLWIDTAPSGNIAIWGWTDGSEYPWRLTLLSTRALRLRGTVGGNAEGETTATVLAVRRPYHISIDIDGEDLTFYIWDDDAQTLTVEEFPGTFSSTSRDQDNGGKFKLKVVDASAALWFDEMRVHDVARTSEEHRDTRFGEIEDGAIPTSVVHYARMNDGTGTTITDSAAGGNDGTLTVGGTGSFAWFWAMEGGSELAGTPKPEVLGYARNIAPVLVDPVRYIYFVSPADPANPIDGIVETFEGGNPHIMDAEATSLYALMTTTPTAGHSLRYSPRGLFRLGASPTLPISADVSGFGSTGNTAPLHEVVEQLVTTRISPTPAVDSAALLALYTATNATNFGVFLPRPEPIRQTLDFLLAGGEAWWGHLRGEQDFYVEQFTGPGAVADHEWDERHIINVEPLDTLQVIYGVEVKYAHNHVVLTEDQVAVAIKGTADWLKFTQEWQYVRRVDPTLHAEFGGSGMLYTVETGIRESLGAALFADFLFQLLAGPKEAWRVTLKAIGKAVKVGQTVTLSVTLQRGRNRLDLDGTTKYVVLDVTDTTKGETQCTLWGGSS